MSLSNKIVSRILIGSAIGALLGLILLIMGIVVVLHALEGRSSYREQRFEIERPVMDEDEDEDEGEGAGHDPYAEDEAASETTSSGAAYPGLEAPEPAEAPPYSAEPLPPQSRSQWRSIFEEDEPLPARPPQAPEPATAPVPRSAQRPPSAPRPMAPRQAPQPQKDEESLFY